MADSEHTETPPEAPAEAPVDSPSKSGAQSPEEGPKDSPSKSASKSKVDVLLKAAGDAPIMKKKKWAVDKSKRIAWIIEFIKKYIKCDSGESVFLYVNQSFSPSPDTDVGTLYECFGSDGKLVLHYCKSQAWG